MTTTTTITTIILLLAVGIVPFSYGQQINSSRLINGCCDLGYGHFTFSRETRQSGVYVLPNICSDDHLEAEAYCDTINGGGGWLVIHRRQDGSVDFNRNWIDYEDGFGELTGEFWYGLRALHCLTGQGGWEMRMDIKYTDGRSIYLQYGQFKVASATENYNLTIGGEYQGTTGGYRFNTITSIATTHNGMQFTTKDTDNDQSIGGNCAVDATQPRGGWWFNNCLQINPNHLYSDLKGILQGSHFVEMKIRPVRCNI